MKDITVWLITAKTNLHVGNENTTNYGIIDNAVQRNVLTNLPCINSSSLKGAINEYISTECSDLISPQDRVKIFGSDKLEKNGNSQKGEAVFFDANLLMLPVQDNNTLFKLKTGRGTVEQIKALMKDLGIENSEEVINREIQNKSCETVDDAVFDDLCSDDSLPIIARNKLENGESKNLWYEQVLPAEAVLLTFIRTSEKKLTDALDGKIVQIGANATIGYGYCKFRKLL